MKGKSVQLESVTEMKDKVIISLKSEGKLDYTPYRLESPLRLVVDMPNALFEESEKKVSVENGTISTINQKNMTTDGKNVARLEIYLVGDTNYLIPEQVGNTLKIEIQRLDGAGTSALEDGAVPKTGEVAPKTEEKKWTNSATKIINVEKSDDVSGTKITIFADGYVKDFESFVLEDPYRLVVDISGVKSSYPNKSIEVGSKDVKNIRIGIHPDKVRFVFESGISSGLNKYNVYSKENKLMVVFGKAIDTAFESDTAETTTPASKTPSAPLSGGAVKLNEIKYEDKADVSRVIISASGTADYTAKMISDSSVVVDIPNAVIDQSLNKSLDVSKSDGPIKSIKTYRTETGGVSSARVIVELSKRVAYNYFSEGTNIIVDFSKREGVSLAPDTTKIEDEGVKPKDITLAQPATLPGETPSTTESEVAAPEVTGPGGDTFGETGDGETKYTGKKISLVFTNADIRNIFQLIAEVSNLNMLVDSDVRGRITLRLVKVPWDQALDIILSTTGLGMTRVGNVIRIARRTTLARERTTELASRRAQEELEDLVTRKVDLSYAPLTAVQAVIRPMLSARGSITTFTQTQSLLITDIAARLDDILKVIKKLDVATPEIRLEVRIVEASDTFTQELGVNWVIAHFDDDANNGYSGSKTTGGTLANTFLNNTNIFDSGFGAIFPSVPSSALGVGGASVVIGLLEDTLRLDIQLRALESMGEVEIIESPKIRVLNNVAAELSITRRIPIRNVTTETSEEGNVSTESEITYQNIVTDLKITPTISADKRVRLDVELTHTTLGDAVSITLDGVLNTYYITDTKEIDTEVLVNNRDTVVIGGLYRKRKSNVDLGLPLLKDIPVLGWLFKTRTTEDTRRELLIFVTPTIVRESEGVVSEINE
ncbi:MAG: type IV pilus secretin PilQ [Deltaproteobacteria bacterium]|uniref:Type IV pilus secretin PilQ n=1 Tax=Candidatus Zymogenus saltonus TaxID=2844893 RepID=A0A9D8KH24_9DELT|nr:type IV pilus secretin PilQ [Candidatus Zymogenus saltonus]